MIYSVETATLRNYHAGELRREVMKWLKKVVSFNNRKWPAVQAELMTNLDGAQGAIHIKMKFESIDACQKFRRDWYQDEEAKLILKELNDLAHRFGGSVFTEDMQHHYYNIVEIQ